MKITTQKKITALQKLLKKPPTQQRADKVDRLMMFLLDNLTDEVSNKLDEMGIYFARTNTKSEAENLVKNIAKEYGTFIPQNEKEK